MKSWFFEKINKTDRPLARLTNKKKKIQMSLIRNETRGIITNTTEIQKIICDYYEHSYAHKLEKSKETAEFLETYNPPRLNRKKQKP